MENNLGIHPDCGIEIKVLKRDSIIPNDMAERLLKFVKEPFILNSETQIPLSFKNIMIKQDYTKLSVDVNKSIEEQSKRTVGD